MKLVRQRKDGHVRMLQPERSVVAARVRHAQPATLVLDDGQEIASTCLRCPDMPCVAFQAPELAAEVGIDATYSPNDQVCPFGAIAASADRTPVIDPSGCVGCGLCIARCPVGAIFRTDRPLAAVNDADESMLPFVPDGASDGFDDMRELMREALAESADLGYSADASVLESLAPIQASLNSGNSRTKMGLLVRNSLLLLGLAAKLGVSGDTSHRVDLIASDGELVALAELEPGNDLLDAVRRLMSDVAIMIGRRGLERELVVPLIVCVGLPNRRGDVYEVISNAANRLDLEISTVPLSALLLLIGSRASADLSDLRTFRVDAQHPTARAALESLLGRDVDHAANLGLVPEK